MPPNGPQPDHEQELAAAKATIKQLFQSDVITDVQVFVPEILQALACIEAQDYAAYALIKSTLKRAKILMRDLSKAMQPYQPRLHVLHPDDPPPIRTARDFLPDAPLPDLIIPIPYALDARSTDYVVVDANGLPHAQAIAYAPLLITGRLQHIDDLGQWLRLEWKRGPTWYTQDIDRGVALNATKLVELASQGLPVATDNAAHVAHYLHLLEAENYQTIPTARMATRLGWQGEQGAYGFLCGRTLARTDEVLTIDDLSSVPTTEWQDNWIAFHGSALGDDQIVRGFHQRGSYKAWCEAVQAVIDFPRVRLAFYGSFAPPLLEILHVPNFVVDWNARTSVGKTTTLRTIASVWGCPDERQAGESIIFSWNATKVWSERAAAVLNGLPFILDESKLAAKGVVPSVLYMVANGIGRGRGNLRGLAQSKRWRTILFSTGESPITGFSEDGGSRMRCLSIRGYPFGTKNGTTLKVVAELNAALCLNYGHAGPRFTQWILQHREDWPTWEQRYAKHKTHLMTLVKDEAAYRLADYGALITLTAELVHEALEFPWEQPEAIPQDLWATIVEEASGAAGDVRALRDVMSWAYAHQETFYGRAFIERDGTPRAPHNGWSGKWEKGANWKEIGFFPLVLNRILHDCGYEPPTILAMWKEEGWLMRDKDGKHIGKNTRIDGEDTRLITVGRSIVELIDQ
jgi:putative DNA primase/helicase